jgi:hypothetical protein
VLYLPSCRYGPFCIVRIIQEFLSYLSFSLHHIDKISPFLLRFCTDQRKKYNPLTKRRRHKSQGSTACTVQAKNIVIIFVPFLPVQHNSEK